MYSPVHGQGSTTAQLWPVTEANPATCTHGQFRVVVSGLLTATSAQGNLTHVGFSPIPNVDFTIAVL